MGGRISAPRATRRAPRRPSGVPAEAWWSPEDNEWILGPKDDRGRLDGQVRYWRPDGSLVCTSELVAGAFHGPGRRYHETGEVAQTYHYERGKLHGLLTWTMTDGHTTERPRAPGLASVVWHGELQYEHDRVTSARYFDRAGVEVDIAGEPIPPRPPGVPATATRNRAGYWCAGSWDAQGRPLGVLRFWSAAGDRFLDEEHVGGELRVTRYDATGAPRRRFTQVAQHVTGEATVLRRDGSLAMRARLGDRSTFEHFDADGSRRRATTYAHEPASPSRATEPTADDQRILDAIAAGAAGLSAGAPALSPVGLGHAIARGWGGDAERDAAVARRMRARVGELAPPALRERLSRLGLDRMPRLQTPERADAVARELAADPAVDGPALRAALIAAGGPGATLALQDPAHARAHLDQRVSEDRKSLLLAHLGLTELPAAIGAYHEVTRLYAEGNRLATLPDEVGDMFLLTSLEVHRNRITALPRSLAALQLETLYLGDNALAGALPPVLFELWALRRLTLGGNQLTELPEAIGDLTTLTSLHLNDNPLRALPASLARLPLTFLHLGAHPWEEPPAVLADCARLEELWLASPALKRLPGAIVKLPALRRLIVWGSALTEIPDELYEATQLRELRIRDNPLPPAVYARLAEALPDTRIY